jgi:hypothetical protein
MDGPHMRDVDTKMVREARVGSAHPIGGQAVRAPALIVRPTTSDGTHMTLRIPSASCVDLRH